MLVINILLIAVTLGVLLIIEDSILAKFLAVVVLILNLVMVGGVVEEKAFEKGVKSVPKHTPAKVQPISAEACYNWWFTPDNRLNKAKQLKADLCKK